MSTIPPEHQPKKRGKKRQTKHADNKQEARQLSPPTSPRATKRRSKKINNENELSDNYIKDLLSDDLENSIDLNIAIAKRTFVNNIKHLIPDYISILTAAKFQEPEVGHGYMGKIYSDSGKMDSSTSDTIDQFHQMFQHSTESNIQLSPESQKKDESDKEPDSPIELSEESPIPEPTPKKEPKKSKKKTHTKPKQNKKPEPEPEPIPFIEDSSSSTFKNEPKTKHNASMIESEGGSWSDDDIKKSNDEQFTRKTLTIPGGFDPGIEDVDSNAIDGLI